MEQKFLLWKILVFLIPKPDIKFVLLVPVKISHQRAKEKNEPFPDDQATLSWRLTAYKEKSEFLCDNSIQIDCLKSVEEVHKKIWTLIDSKNRAKVKG